LINDIDEMNCTPEDEAKYKKKTISSIKTIKHLHGKKEEIKKYCREPTNQAGRNLPMICRRSKRKQRKS